MKLPKFLLLLVAAAILPISGCGKKAAPAQSTADTGGVQVDMAKLNAAFANSPDQAAKAQAADAERDFRYGQYAKCLEEIEALSKNPGLNEQQKAVVGQVVDQLKQTISKVGASR